MTPLSDVWSLNKHTRKKASAYSRHSMPADPGWSVSRDTGFVPETLWPPGRH